MFSLVTKGYEDPDTIFSRFFGDFENVFGYDRYHNKNGDLVTEIEVPGFNEDNISVAVSDGILTIKGERTNPMGAKKELFKRFTVGQSEEVHADLKDGILSLTFKQPKKEKTKIVINKK